MSEREYLVSYGLAGAFGRFHSALPLACARGDRVVVRTHRGLEAGVVLREAVPGHALFLPNSTVGQLLRPFAPADARAEAGLRDRAADIWSRACQLAEHMGLPLAVLDAEPLLDGEHVVLHHLSGSDCDVRPFVSTLSREFSLHILLDDLTPAGQELLVHDEASCGSGCGSCGSEGGCGSCGSGCNSCGSKAADANHFAALRAQMERQRTSLI
jgi:hypothetical protein